MRINLSAVASVALLSFFSFVMADGERITTKFETNADGSVRTIIEEVGVAMVETEIESETDKVAESEPVSIVEPEAGVQPVVVIESELVTVFETVYEPEPEIAIKTVYEIVESPLPTGHESQPESTKPGYETETVDNAVVKLSFSMLSGLVALFAI
jgi:hypothetical protein